MACPWCYIAKHRFDNALSRFEHRDQVEVIWRSYQLDPEHPPSRTRASTTACRKSTA
ncbi:DsbA family protein [Mesorhizobium australafricanum]|uniref:DsbA family protein n=1 Tax=Mesorhizobium australafricanum TaxID=3072311 RepID=UPI003D31832A